MDSLTVMLTVKRNEIELNEDEVRRRETILARLIFTAAQKKLKKQDASPPVKVPSHNEKDHPDIGN